jgi:hypothetical protein
MLSVVALNVVVLIVVMLSVVILNVVVLIALMLSVFAMNVIITDCSYAECLCTECY